MNQLYTLGHWAYEWDKFLSMISPLDILIDIRKIPYSQYHSQYNRNNLEKELENKYIYKGKELGWSPEFHNDLITYVKSKGEDLSWKLNELIWQEEQFFIFSKNIKVSNDDKRKNYITEHYLKYYIDNSKKEEAILTLKKILEKYQDKKIWFFCSEKDKSNCHRHHLLVKEWLSELWYSEKEIIELKP